MADDDATIAQWNGSSTAAVHADGIAAKRGKKRAFSTDADVAPPLSLSTTFQAFPDGERGHVYSRYSNPTRDRCETILGAIEGSPESPAHAILYSSGLSACFAALAWLLPKHVAAEGGYHGTYQVIKQLHRLSGGAKCIHVSLPKPEELKSSSLEPGDVLWLESPRNPTCDLVDIAAYVKAAKEVGVRVAVDGTFAPPPLQRPLTLGADVVMHATTKSLAGHSDVLGGALCVSKEADAVELRSQRGAFGTTPGQMEAWLLMRSLRTLHLRVVQQSKTAEALARWLHGATVAPKDTESNGKVKHPLAGFVKVVHHPVLSQEGLARKQMPGGCGGCFSFELTSEKAASALPLSLTLFRDATSLGGVETLIEWRRKYDAAVSPLLLRVSIGLEELEHLQADLQQGIVKVSSQKD